MPTTSSTAARIRPGVFAELERHIDAHLARGGELIPLHIGDTHLAPPRAAQFDSAIGRGDDAALYRYGATIGLTDLRAAICSRHQARGFSWIEESKHVHIGVGGTHALFVAARATLDAGDEVLVAAPYWPLAPGIFHACGALPIEVPLTSRLYQDPSLDAGEIFARAITPRTKAIYVITPNNPDGKILSRVHLEQIANVARAHDLWVFADEVYADITFDAPHVSIAHLPEMSSRTITLYSLSKSHALAGARIGYVIAPEHVIKIMRRASVHTVFNAPVAMQRSAVAALTSGDDFIEAARQKYLSARDAASRALAASRDARIRFSIAEGAAYIFADFRDVLGARPLADLLARAIDRGVLLAPGDAFGDAYARCARICFTSAPIERVVQGIERLVNVVDELA